MTTRIESLMRDIRAARVALAGRGMEVEEMAALCGLGRGSIIRLGHAHWRPRIDTVQALEALLLRAARRDEAPRSRRGRPRASRPEAHPH